MKLYRRDLAGGRRPLDLGTSLGGGGEGKIYADARDPTVAVKLFKTSDAGRRDKIEAMLAKPPAAAVDRGVSGEVRVQLAWPQALVVDSLGTFCGFAMPRIDSSHYCPLETILIPTARDKEKLPGDSARDYRFRIGVARNLAAAVAEVHAVGHALVDIKPANLFLDKNNGAVAIVDCDGSRIASPHKLFPAAVATEEYLAPEFHGKVQYADARQDRFALAMVIFRLLNNDLYPMTGIALDDNAPASNVQRIKANLLTVVPGAGIRQHAKSVQDFLPDETIAMFRNGFSHAQSLRPSATQWMSHLDELIGKLKICPANMAHAALPAGCPWCDQEAKARASAKAAAKTTTQTVRATPVPVTKLAVAAPSQGTTPISPLPPGLMAVRVLSALICAVGFALLAWRLWESGSLALAMYNHGLLRYLGPAAQICEVLVRTVYYGAPIVAGTFPFYFAYVHSFEGESLANPRWAWPSFIAGLPLIAILVAIVVAFQGTVVPDHFESPISEEMARWTGWATVGAWAILAWAALLLVGALAMIGNAFVGLWDRDSRFDFLLNLV